MGENKHIKELDAFAKKYVKEIKEEAPSLDFTFNLMDSILKIEKSKVFKVQPLISKKVWLIVLGVVVALFFIPFKTSEKSLLNLPEVDFSFFDKFQMPNLFESISVSNTVLYAVFFFGLMIIAQVVFLKNHFDKKFE